MRIVKYPPSKPEVECECPHCHAVLAYSEDDILDYMGVGGIVEYIICAYCNKDIKLKYTPYPHSPLNKISRFSS